MTRRSTRFIATTVGLAPAALVAQTTAGSITGRVIDRSNALPIPAAQIQVVGTQRGSATNENGTFRIAGLPAGAYQLRVIRIGYVAQTVAVQIGAGQANAQVSVALAPSNVSLEQVIVTATGPQSRRQFANVVAQVQADSVLRTAPATNVNELLQARTPGVQIIQGFGETGSSSSIRIRGTSSLSLSNEPLIIVDGIRYNNDPVTAANLTSGVTTTRVNRFQVDPDEVASIDIVKGPSAAALYGTAAANGVVIIQTKRGLAGRTRWTGIGELGSVSQPSSFEPNWWSFGHNVTNGVVGTRVVHCLNSQRALGQCTVDSTTSYNPYTEAPTDPYANGGRETGAIQASGGNNNLTYFVSGERQQETGPYHMPDFEQQRLSALGQSLTSTQIRPNQLAVNAVRGNFGLTLAPNATLSVSTGYQGRSLYTPFSGGYFAGMQFQFMTAPGYRTPTNGTQREFVGDIFSVEQRLQDDRLTGSAALNWTPVSWVDTRATVGIDATSSYNYRLQVPGEGTHNGSAWGPSASQGYSGKDAQRANTNVYSVDVSATATRDLTSALRSRTTVGGRWFRTGFYDSELSGYGLPPGSTEPNAAAQRLSWESVVENAQYGVLLQEDLQFRNRLFLSLGVGQDHNSAFGRSVGNTTYPRGGVSYVISDEPWFPRLAGVSRLRLRTAVGRSGVQPGTVAALQYYQSQTYPIFGVEQPGLRFQALGNANLKPEVTTEVEGGADIGFFNDRVTVEATLFNKLSRDALYALPLSPSLGVAAGTQFYNLGKVQNRGQELAIDALVFRSVPLTWNLRVNGSHIRNKLVSAGDVVLPTPQGARIAVGYPLFGLWDKPYTYNDANKDGLIVPSEITASATDAFRGSTLPEYEAGLNNVFGFFNNRLRVSTLLDYRGNFWNQWGYQYQRCGSSLNCQAINDPTAPTADQAAAVASTTGSLYNTRWGYFVRNDFIRLREVAFSYELSDRLTRRYLRGRSLSVAVSGRNLGVLWTKYPGLDPEANSSVANTGGGNNDFYAEPALRYWVAKFNLGF